MRYNYGINDTNPLNSKNDTTKPVKQPRPRCYTCTIRKPNKAGTCKHLINNECPHGYHSNNEE